MVQEKMNMGNGLCVWDEGREGEGWGERGV